MADIDKSVAILNFGTNNDSSVQQTTDLTAITQTTVTSIITSVAPTNSTEESHPNGDFTKFIVPVISVVVLVSVLLGLFFYLRQKHSKKNSNIKCGKKERIEVNDKPRLLPNENASDIFPVSRQTSSTGQGFLKTITTNTTSQYSSPPSLESIPARVLFDCNRPNPNMQNWKLNRFFESLPAKSQSPVEMELISRRTSPLPSATLSDHTTEPASFCLLPTTSRELKIEAVRQQLTDRHAAEQQQVAAAIDRVFDNLTSYVHDEIDGVLDIAEQSNMKLPDRR